ncbi:hypothetical protein MMC31_000476 [Peltigera leucophlebia]|nr:hypothetical protein [Peltigera leucophlebia]
MVIEQVQLADIEDAAYVPPGSNIIGGRVGNWMWRSPEAHVRGRVNKYSDIFSFGVVVGHQACLPPPRILEWLFTSAVMQCIYAVFKRLIFAVDEEELADGEEPLAVVLERQISYFADKDGMNGLLKHLGDSPSCDVFEVIRDGFNEANPCKPFSLWKGVGTDFKDLIGGLMNFDPTKRLTAHEALAHRWFGDV